MNKLKEAFFLLLGVVIIVWSFYVFLQKPAPAYYQEITNNRQPTTDNKILKIGEQIIEVEIADTNEERAQGLSGRETLEIGHGLLFVFETPGIYSFWMKDMKFPIDIIWIDEHWTVVGVERGVTPETFPKSFLPNSPVKYVLELPNTESFKLGIDTGSTLFLDDQI